MCYDEPLLQVWWVCTKHPKPHYKRLSADNPDARHRMYCTRCERSGIATEMTPCEEPNEGTTHA